MRRLVRCSLVAAAVFMAAVLSSSKTSASGGVPAIAAGGFHSCYVAASGALQCWGDNSFGKLGDGTTTNRPTPVGVSGLSSGVQAVAVPGYVGDFTCALTATGGVKCWGDNSSGELGTGTGLSSVTPVDVSGLSSGVAAITAGGGGGGHACALTTGGGVKCWGYNANGELGDGTTSNRLAPVDVVGLSSGVVSIAAGGTHTCALMSGGAVKCWGRNVWGTLGNGTTTNSSTPVDVSGLSGVVAIAGGADHTCALTSGGGAKCWGYNGLGAVGDGTGVNRSLPTDVSGLTSGVAIISAGLAHSCAVLTDGTPRCWGYNEFGQVGDGSATTRLAPVAVIGVTSAVGIAAGGIHSCALVDDGTAKCWGDNANGQLGDGTTTGRLTAVDVLGLDLSAPPDADSDGIVDSLDNCPAVPNAGQDNNDGDAEGDACDPDDDNDLATDGSDNCPLIVNADQANYDGDADGDACDPDDDNDGVADASDAFPFNALEWIDTDGDGLGNNYADPDDDNDGIADSVDVQPLTVSNDYAFDAMTFGTVSRSGLSITIAPAPPPVPGGTAFVLRASASGAAVGDASISACGGSPKQIHLGSGETADWVCTGTTLTVKSVTGMVELWGKSCGLTCYWKRMRFLAEGREGSLGSPVTAAASNDGPVHVDLLDEPLNVVGSFDLDAGESVDVEVVSGAGGEDALQLEVLHGQVSVTVFGQTATLSEGDGPTEFAVQTPTIVGLIDRVNAMTLDRGNKQALFASLQAAQASLSRGNVSAARGQLGAFINKVEALKKSKRLSAAAADALIAQAQLLL